MLIAVCFWNRRTTSDSFAAAPSFGACQKNFRARGRRNLWRVTGFVHQLDFELSQLVIVKIHCIRRSGH